MLFRQLFDRESSTYTYLLADEAERLALLIDPVREQLARDVQLLSELGLTLVYVLDTHTHADHVTAAGMLRARTGAQTVAGARAAPCVNKHVRDQEVLSIGGLRVHVLETPGHTDDSVSYLVDGRVFTGDALLIRAAGRTDLQFGNATRLYDSITTKLFELPDDTLVYPAHDYRGLTVSTIGEEKRFNLRIAGRSRDAFVQVMGALELSPPQELDSTLAANRICGLKSEVVQG